MKGLALISTPWPIFNRPSIQLGTLKAYMKKHLPRISVDSLHIYLRIASGLGYPLYHKISQRTRLSEPLYAALLYPEKVEKIERGWKGKNMNLPDPDGPGFRELLGEIEALSTQIIDSVNWTAYGLIGFSICLGQLTSALYFIRCIKKASPSSKIVIGGSMCAGGMGKSLIENFKEIDYVVCGEGERPLLELVKSLDQWEEGHPPCQVRSSQVTALDELPLPDYDDFFHELSCLGTDKHFIPKIPVEISRGCWYSSGVSGGCSFCNLNIQWEGYRRKSNERVVKEIELLSEKYETLSISFVDNLLPASGLESLFGSIRSLRKDFDMFCEVRAHTPLHVLKAMAEAGMQEIQAGVESLSSSLLKKLNKGTRAIDNIEIMKNCEAMDTPHLAANLILCFPSSDEADVSETMKNLDFVWPLRPLKGIDFWLGYGSPVWRMPGKFGIKKIGNHRFYKNLFPEETLSGLKLMMQGYQGKVRYQQKLWRPVRERINQWEEFYQNLHRSPRDGPILSYRDSGHFMVIHQRLSSGENLSHRLRGTSREIYLFCESKKSMNQLLAAFSRYKESEMESFLCLMVEKRLMFRDGDFFLSLAVPATSSSKGPARAQQEGVLLSDRGSL